ncbi:MAG TPA: hypothetical protein VG186_04950 [Solirubrobacteraceae bacterium]|jgi:hypothetical protein|nr:hypothetical protein [Solirubrobacteraceae bacterium]
MPANVSPGLAPSLSTDPRLQPGAYITDGEVLFWVQRAAFRPTPNSLRANVLVVEDCRTNEILEVDLERVSTTCTLVREALSP